MELPPDGHLLAVRMPMARAAFPFGALMKMMCAPLQIIALGACYFFAVTALDITTNVGTIDDLTSFARIVLVRGLAALWPLRNEPAQGPLPPCLGDGKKHMTQASREVYRPLDRGGCRAAESQGPSGALCNSAGHASRGQGRVWQDDPAPFPCHPGRGSLSAHGLRRARVGARAGAAGGDAGRRVHPVGVHGAVQDAAAAAEPPRGRQAGPVQVLQCPRALATVRQGDG